MKSTLKRTSCIAIAVLAGIVPASASPILNWIEDEDFHIHKSKKISVSQAGTYVLQGTHLNRFNLQIAEGLNLQCLRYDGKELDLASAVRGWNGRLGTPDGNCTWLRTSFNPLDRDCVHTLELVFGQPQGAAVPDGGSTALLAGLALAPIWFLRRRNRKEGQARS